MQGRVPSYIPIGRYYDITVSNISIIYSQCYMCTAVRLDYERGRHWRMVFEENEDGVEDNKLVIHSKMWYLYMNDK